MAGRNSRRHRSGGGGGIGAAAAAADVDEAAGGAGRSLTAAADALGAAGGEGVLNTAADAAKNAKNKTKISKMLQTHINIRAGRNQLLTRLITRQERPEEQGALSRRRQTS